MHDLLPLKPVEWVGSALDDLRAFPAQVQDEIGYALYLAQCGEHPAHAKRLRGPLGGLLEIVEDFDGMTFRLVYTAKLRGVVYALHAFQKKSTSGIATPKREIDMILARLARARAHYAVTHAKDGR